MPCATDGCEGVVVTPCERGVFEGVRLGFIERIIPHFVRSPKPGEFLGFVQDLKLNGFSRLVQDLKLNGFSRFDRGLKPD